MPDITVQEHLSGDCLTEHCRSRRYTNTDSVLQE